MVMPGLLLLPPPTTTQVEHVCSKRDNMDGMLWSEAENRQGNVRALSLLFFLCLSLKYMEEK